ncbi:MAG: hypothetical protein ACRELF_18910, partial [Gemmataceae bacterium]
MKPSGNLYSVCVSYVLPSVGRHDTDAQRGKSDHQPARQGGGSPRSKEYDVKPTEVEMKDPDG